MPENTVSDVDPVNRDAVGSGTSDDLSSDDVCIQDGPVVEISSDSESWNSFEKLVTFSAHKNVQKQEKDFIFLIIYFIYS